MLRSGIDAMEPIPPTTLAVSAAVAHLREVAGLTACDLAAALHEHGHPLTFDDALAIERRERPVTVDDLVALAVVLGLSPVGLMAHVPDDLPDTEEARLGMAVPVPVDAEQQEAAAAELGELAMQEADAGCRTRRSTRADARLRPLECLSKAEIAENRAKNASRWQLRWREDAGRDAPQPKQPYKEHQSRPTPTRTTPRRGGVRRPARSPGVEFVIGAYGHEAQHSPADS